MEKVIDNFRVLSRPETEVFHLAAGAVRICKFPSHFVAFSKEDSGQTTTNQMIPTGVHQRNVAFRDVPAGTCPANRRRAGASMVHLEPAEVLAVRRVARARGAREWAMVLVGYKHGMRIFCSLPRKDCSQFFRLFQSIATDAGLPSEKRHPHALNLAKDI